MRALRITAKHDHAELARLEWAKPLLSWDTVLGLLEACRRRYWGS
jgi:hypothetical protein